MFNTIVAASLKHRVIVVLASVAVLVFGVWSVVESPIDVFPDLNKPTVIIMTEAGGMAPEEVELRISAQLELSLNGIPGIESIRSISSAGLSFVYLTFKWETDIYRARQMVSERLSSIDRLPEGITPHMGPISSIMGEIMLIAIPIDTKTTDAMKVREYADWVVRPRLMAIPGIAQVVPIGGEVRQFQVQPLPALVSELGVTYEEIASALHAFASNSSGGFIELNGKEYLIRHIGSTSRLEDLKNLAITQKNGQPVILQQIANVQFAPAVKRGDAGYQGKPAVILGIQKQPLSDTKRLTSEVELALAELAKSTPAGISPPSVTFRQATFIENSIATLQGKLVGAALFIAAVLLVFLGTLRPTIISLTAIPISILLTELIFRYFNMSINTMTLGGIAIAIGGLVDDAVVDVENILRRLKENRQKPVEQRASIFEVVRDASIEVRSAILYSTIILVLVFLPLFFLPGIEGRLFMPLGIAFVVSTLASLVVSITVTPVLSATFLPRAKVMHQGDTRFLRWLKNKYESILKKVLAAPKPFLFTMLGLVVIAGGTVPFFSTTFLPPFNEGVLVVTMRLQPGTTLSESVKMAQIAEQRISEVRDVEHVGRRSGRAELDEHAEGVHVNELDVSLRPYNTLSRHLPEIISDIRATLSGLPVSVSIGQPISHRIDHMMSGVRAAIAIRIFGDNLDTLRTEAARVAEKLRRIDGLADLEIEKQVLVPQIKVRLDYAACARYGIPAPQVLRLLEQLVQGEEVTEIIEGSRSFDLVLKLPESERSIQGLTNILIDTPLGRVPLYKLASIEDSDGPNQISRDNGKRRIVLSANPQGRALSDVVRDIRLVLSDTKLPDGYFTTLEGQFEAQEKASRTIVLFFAVSLLLICLLLYMRYKSALLVAVIMVNIPLSLIGAVGGLWLAGQPLSIAATVGFITLAGISTRNGILLTSHFVNLIKREGELFGMEMIIRGSKERLSPLLMTALVTVGALTPLLFEADHPGTELLFPLAVVIVPGLAISTIMDTFLTPALYLLFGKKGAEKLRASETTVVALPEEGKKRRRI